MNRHDKMFAFVKRWQGLEASRKDLDHAYGEFARDLRAAVPSDAEFIAWCARELGLTSVQAYELLARAEVAKLVRSPQDMTDLGGWDRSLSKLDRLPNMPQRAAAVNTARATGKTVGTIVREMTRAAQPAKPAEPERDPRIDVRTLASFIERCGVTCSPAIRAIVDFYTGRRSSAPVARRKA